MSKLLKLKGNTWTSQPQALTAIDYAGAGGGLKHLFSPPDMGGVRNIVSGAAATKVGNGFTVEASPIGLINKNTVSGDYYTDPCAISGYPFTLFIVAYTTTTLGGGVLLSIYKGGAGALFLRITTDFATKNYPAFAIADTSVISATNHNLINSPRSIAVVCRSSTDHELYVDGISVGTSSVAGPAIDATYKIGLGYKTDQNYVSTGRPAPARTSLAGIYDSALSSNEIYALFKNVNAPYAVFKPQSRNIWIPDAGGGGGFQPAWAMRKARTIGTGVI